MKEQKAEHIVVLKGLESVWQNPARFIGDLSTRGMHHLVDELIANSIDEAMSGYCNNIDVKLLDDSTISVSDDGRGIPVEEHPTEKKSALEVVLTTLDAGGKMRKDAYEYSGGLHGVGLSVVNALSEFLEVEVKRNGKKYFQRYEKGKPVTKLKVLGNAKGHGTNITFKPDEAFFGKTKFRSTILTSKIKDFAHLNKDLKLTFAEEGGEEIVYQFSDGIKTLVEELNEGTSVIPSKAVLVSGKIEHEANEVVLVDIGFQYNDSSHEKIKTYANSIHTVEGGVHEAGFKLGFVKAVNDFIEQKLRQNKLEPDYIREGLTVVVSIKLRKPEFESQTKTKLTNPWLKNVLSKFVYEKVYEFLESDIQVAKKIAERALVACRAAEAAKRARNIVKRKGLLDKITAIPGKIADCEVKDASKAEIFIVEGDSAGGSAKQARSRKNQAVLPLKGKILNVEKKNISEILKNEEIKILIQALGCGIDTTFDITKLRYHKIIIMTDADSDGSHIRTLLLTFFYRTMPELVKKGHIYIAEPPLYKVAYSKKQKYLKNDEELYKFFIEMLDKICIISNSAGKRFEGAELKEIISSLVKYKEYANFIARKKNPLIVDFILRFTFIRKESIWESKDIDLLNKELNSYVSMLSKMYPKLNPIKLNFHANDEIKFEFITEDKGTVFDVDFMRSPTFINMEKVSYKLRKLGNPPYYIEFIDKGTAVSFNDLFELTSGLIEYSRSRLDIQRYKGLGEMNPEQLWETTMNPETRNIFKVDIDDEESADEITSILMGDGVELRRKFIDINALNVKNLDV